MTGPGFAQVLHFDGGLWVRAADGWGRLVDRVRRHAEAILAPLGAVERAWEGPAAQLALARGRELHTTVEAMVLPLRRHQQILIDVAEGGVRLRERAREVRDRAAAAGVLVSPDGVVTPAGVDAGFAAAAVESVRQQVAEVLAEAARLDADAVRRLAEDAPWVEVHAFVARAAIPEPGTAPAVVHRWWQQLDPAQRRYLLSTFPGLIGALDGVPVDARDQANRVLLERERRRVAAELEDLEQRLRDLPGPAERMPGGRELASELAAAAATLRALDLIVAARSRRPPDGQRGYLIDFDPSGTGRVVLSLGNPDHADNVLTYVPGTGTTLASLPGHLDRSNRMARDAEREAPEQRTATVYWLGYDTPPTLPAATNGRFAVDASDDLRRYAESLEVTHTGDGARQTFLGHSYGTTVVGAAASDGLAADSLVFVGSPGVGADSVHDLGVDPAHVWSTTAVTDPIRLSSFRHHVQLADGVPVPVANLVGAPDMPHGRDPSASGFGGQTFESDVFSGHSGYWDDGNVAREHIARVAVGHHHDR